MDEAERRSHRQLPSLHPPRLWLNGGGDATPSSCPSSASLTPPSPSSLYAQVPAKVTPRVDRFIEHSATCLAAQLTSHGVSAIATTSTPVMAVLSYGLVSFGRLTVFGIDGKVGKVVPWRRQRPGDPGRSWPPLLKKPTQRALKRVAYRPREVAEMVGMSESGVRNLIKRGTLRAVQLDGRWLIPAAAIEDKLGVQLDASAAADATPDTAQTPA
jgi:excisionase family DNA binding protein